MPWWAWTAIAVVTVVYGALLVLGLGLAKASKRADRRAEQMLSHAPSHERRDRGTP